MQNQQVPITHTQGVITQNIMHTKQTADQNGKHVKLQILTIQRHHQSTYIAAELLCIAQI